MKKWLWFVGLAVALLGLDAGLSIAVLTNAKTPEPKFAEALRFAFTMLAASSVIFTCFFNIWQSIETEGRRADDLAKESQKQKEDELRRTEDRAVLERQRQADRDWQKMENTFRLLAGWDQPAFMKARDFVRRNRSAKDTWNARQLREAIEQDEELNRSVRLMFNYCDDVLQSLRQDRVAAAVVRQSFSPAFATIHDFFKPWIDNEPENYRSDLTELQKLLN